MNSWRGHKNLPLLRDEARISRRHSIALLRALFHTKGNRSCLIGSADPIPVQNNVLALVNIANWSIKIATVSRIPVFDNAEGEILKTVASEKAKSS
jgi:hypothetical protein